ncbi:hypothetical protein FRA_48c14120 [Francisella sp. W12-1067]|nr:hypothetical protein FRA_48c14120 [Francisella sp. W12-1067]
MSRLLPKNWSGFIDSTILFDIKVSSNPLSEVIVSVTITFFLSLKELNILYFIGSVLRNSEYIAVNSFTLNIYNISFLYLPKVYFLNTFINQILTNL